MKNSSESVYDRTYLNLELLRHLSSCNEKKRKYSIPQKIPSLFVDIQNNHQRYHNNGHKLALYNIMSIQVERRLLKRLVLLSKIAWRRRDEENVQNRLMFNIRSSSFALGGNNIFSTLQKCSFHRGLQLMKVLSLTEASVLPTGKYNLK